MKNAAPKGAAFFVTCFMISDQKTGLEEFRQIMRQLIGLTAWDITGVGGTAHICSAQFGEKHKHQQKIGEHTLETEYGDFALNIHSAWKIIVQGNVLVKSEPSFLQKLTIKSVSGLWSLDGQIVQDVMITDELDLHLVFVDGQILQVIGKLRNPKTAECSAIGWLFSSKSDMYQLEPDATVTIGPYER